MNIIIIHGPNLNLLGDRQPEIYGKEGFESVINKLKANFPNVRLAYFQSNIEGELVTAIQNTKDFDAIVLNAGGYSHTSVAIADAVAAIKRPVIGIHISNIYTREKERHTDLLAKYCMGTITGLGVKGYELALKFFTEMELR